jgi:hypothetical protein
MLTSEINTVVGLLNTALEPIGFNISWPQVTTLSDGTIQITPLIVGINNSALGQELIGANLGAIQTVRASLLNALFGLNCNIPGYVEIADIVLGVPEGGGDLDIDLGGASAVTTDQSFSSPFSTVPPLGVSDGGGADLSTLPSDTFSPGTPAIPGTAGTTVAPTTTPSGGGQKVSLGPISKSMSCHSVGPAGGGCDSSNVALPVGLIGLALLAGLAAWDYVRQRRRTRLHELEAQ